MLVVAFRGFAIAHHSTRELLPCAHASVRVHAFVLLWKRRGRQQQLSNRVRRAHSPPLYGSKKLSSALPPARHMPLSTGLRCARALLSRSLAICPVSLVTVFPTFPLLSKPPLPRWHCLNGAQRITGSFAPRDPAKRNQNLRAFLAERRRNQRAEKPNDEDDGGISVLVPPGGRRESPDRGAFLAPAAGVEQEEEDGADAGGAAAARRNIGLDFDEENRAWGRGGGECAKEQEEKEEKCKDEHGVASSGGNDGSRMSSRSPSWENRDQENAADGEAAGALEGVHPGLATYDSQRSAGVDGGDRAGQEEYARMLELMQQVRDYLLCAKPPAKVFVYVQASC